MSEHLIIVVLMALVSYGAHIAMQDGMIAARLGRLFAKLPTALHKPTHTCPPCCVSTWGTSVWLGLVLGLGLGFPIWTLPIHIIAAAGLAAYLNK